MFTIYGSRKRIKLLELYYSFLVLKMWQLKDQNVVEAKVVHQCR